MGRRSDHTRSELRELMLEEGHRQLAEVGLARFSARDVAKRIGYSVGTLYNVFGSYDELMLAINARTLSLWLTHLRTRLAESEDDDRIATLVRGYFEFAAEHQSGDAVVVLALGEPGPQVGQPQRQQIGRASCRERV